MNRHHQRERACRGLATLVVGAVFVVCVAVPALSETPANSVSDEIRTMRQSIADQQKRLAEMEAKLKELESAQASGDVPVTAKTKVRVDGYAQLRYRTNTPDFPNEFFLRRARLNVRAFSGKHIAARTELAMDNRLPGQATGSRVAIKEVWIEYSSDANKMRMGQTTIPFDYELLTSSSRLWTGERALVLDRLFPDQVDYGLTWQYNANAKSPTLYMGLFNGSGYNLDDENSAKDPMMSLAVPVRNGSVMVGYYKGTEGEEPSQTDRNRYGAGINLNPGKFAFVGEYIAGQDLGNNVEGWYSQLGYKLTKRDLLFVKHDAYNENKAVPGSTFNRTSIGWFKDFDPNVRLTVVYDIRSADENFSDRARLDGDLGYVQWQMMY